MGTEGGTDGYRSWTTEPNSLTWEEMKSLLLQALDWQVRDREEIARLREALELTWGNLRTLMAASPGWRGHGAWLAVVESALGVPEDAEQAEPRGEDLG